MRQLLIICLLAACGDDVATSNDAAVPDLDAAVADTAPDYDRLFPQDRIVDVDLAITDADWATLLVDPLADVYVPATLTYDGVVVPQIAIRFKGNSSRNSVAMRGGTRYSFKIDTDELVDGQRVLGVDKLNLNNGFKDPSYLRETIAYALLRAQGVPVPRTAFARFTINGQPHGLYTVVEQIDKDFLRAHFADDTGDLLKPDNPSGTLLDRGDTFADYADSIEVKTNEEDTVHASFIAFIDVVNHGTAAELDAVFDVDTFLRWLAVNTALVNMDSYAGSAHNYYLYEDRSRGKWVYLPWDVNESFGNFTCGKSAAQLVALPWDAPYCEPAMLRVLITKVLAEAAWKQQYRVYLQQVLDGPFSEDALAADVDRWAALIRADVAADPTKFFTTADFETNLHDVVTKGMSSMFGLTGFRAERAAALSAQMQ